MNSVRKIQTVALTMLLAGASLASAQQEAQLNPHRPVSSDGTAVAMPEMSANFAEGFEGHGPALAMGASFYESGAVVDGAMEVSESAEDVWALWENAGIKNILAGSIIGPDGRTRVNPTTTYPWRAIGLVTFSGGSCTGWLINANTVATAGHCVHSGGPGGNWRTNVRFYPARNGSVSPYGSCTAKRLHSVTGWTGSSDETYDYGAIKLNCNVGNTVGWFGFFYTGSSLNGLPATVSGYPDDKAFQQWRMSGTISATQTRQVFYKNDTRPGQSGAPVFYNRSGCGQCSMGIHAYGVHGAAPHNANNHATRITQAVFNNLVSWKNAS